MYNITVVKISWCGEIGRRKGLKIPRWRHRTGSSPVTSTKKAPFIYRIKGAFLSDAFLGERDAHFVRDAGFARDARLRRV